MNGVTRDVDLSLPQCVARYCVVHNFVRVDNKDFACVEWLSKPHYPFLPNPLVVRVRRYRNTRNDLPSVVPLDRIDPTPVLVDPDNDGHHYFMMRLKGFDRLVGGD